MKSAAQTRLKTHLAAALLAVVGGVGHASAAPTSDELKEARKRFDAGITLFNEGDAQGALVEFRRAYSIDPRYQVLYNIARVLSALNEHAEALETYEKFLSDGGDKIAPSRRTEVEKEIERLSTRVATLDIATQPPGASLAIDDVPFNGVTPAKVRVKLGRRRVSVSMPGFLPTTTTVDIAGAESKKLSLTLVELAPKPVAAPVASAEEKPAPPPEPVAVIVPSAAPTTQPRTVLSTGATVGWIATGTMLTGAIITGAVALSAKHERDDLRDSLGSSASEIRSSNDRARTFAIASDVLSATTVVFAGVSLYLTLKPSREGQSALVVSPGRVGLSTSFLSNDANHGDLSRTQQDR
ncbi:MAG: PEGA domain-containing protein [Polyangiaceae bacterium]